MLKKNDFYYKYIYYKSESIKEEYIRNYLVDEYIYKFISFNNDISLNQKKIELLQSDKVWASNPNCFDDPSELRVNMNAKKVARKTNRSINNVKNLFALFHELYDVSCFTYKNEKYMWEKYANSYNGICLCFSILKTENLFPVKYVKKEDIDFTKEVIKSVNSFDNKNSEHICSTIMSLMPNVIKDYSYDDEKEIRVLFSPFDDPNGYFKGRILPNIKEKLNYRGSPISYEFCGLKLEKIIIGEKTDQKYKKKIYDIFKERDIKIKEKTL